jgi:VIT1/CCC1 family predicted Fe2+/Mn2+ transporter
MSRQSILQKAFRKKDKKLAKEQHSKKIIKASLDHPDEHSSSGKYLSDAVYGALDGIVTTFAIVSGVVGADLNLGIILILGFANLLADGFSMAAGSYLSIKSEQDYHQAEYNREKWEIENYPEGEIEEVRQIYRRKGFKGKDLENAVKIIISDKKRWLSCMMLEELGIVQDDKSPKKVAWITFIAFVICGFVPLISFITINSIPSLSSINPFIASSVLAGLTIFTVGALRSLFIAKKWFWAGLEMFIIGGAASTVAYAIGYFLRGLA